MGFWNLAPVIREFRAGEELDLHEVFYSAVHALAPGQYSSEQLDAWAPIAFDRDGWIGRMRALKPFVVERGGEVLGYADLQPSGYIDHFYVGAGHGRQGIGALLMGHMQQFADDSGIRMLTSDVSLTAQPFFERFGFSVVEPRERVIGNVRVPNVFMRKG